mgnify:CR=1 FL=1
MPDSTRRPDIVIYHRPVTGVSWWVELLVSTFLLIGVIVGWRNNLPGLLVLSILSFIIWMDYAGRARKHVADYRAFRTWLMWESEKKDSTISFYEIKHVPKESKDHAQRRTPMGPDLP